MNCLRSRVLLFGLLLAGACTPTDSSVEKPAQHDASQTESVVRPEEPANENTIDVSAARPHSEPAAEKPAGAGSEHVSDGADENPRYTYREDHDPDGIGKFYMGREIAHVMGYGYQGRGAEWLERNQREEQEKLTLLVKTLKLKPGNVVADIGAGSGVVSMLLARELGLDGYVVAVDVQQQMLDRLALNLKRLGITNVKPVKGTVKSPGLKEKSVDLAILVDVYHEFEFPFEMMRSISRSLKPGGRAVFVEYRMEDPTVPIKLVHKMTEAQVKKEIAQPAFGLKWKETIDVLPRQHIVIFERTEAIDH